MIGVHTPETRQEHDVAAVRQKLRESGLEFPVLLDNQRKNWRSWGNTMWPSVYLIDKRGYVRSWWMGELNWKDAGGEKIMRERIKKLLAEPVDPPTP